MLQFTKTLYSMISPGRTRTRSISHTGLFPPHCTAAVGGFVTKHDQQILGTVVHFIYVPLCLYSWVIALHWASLIYCVFFSISTGNIPFTLNVRVKTELQTNFTYFILTHTNNLPPTCFSSLFLHVAESFLDKGRSRKCSKYSILAKCHF